MIPWIQLDSAKIPGSSDELRLKRRGGEFSIMLGANELMNSRLSGSEEALARLSCAKIRGRPQPKILIGGLGMGFTLRAALAELPPDAAVVVAELVPSVIAWARGPMAGLFAGCLDDPRVEIRDADVAGLIGSAKAVYDAILLDVDNGPDGLSRSENDRLYSIQGLAAARAALKPGGSARCLVGASRPGLCRAAETIRLRGGGGPHARPWQTWRAARYLAGDAAVEPPGWTVCRSCLACSSRGSSCYGACSERSCRNKAVAPPPL